MIHVLCVCGRSLKVKPEFAGRRVICPTCKHKIEVPLPESPEGADEDPFSLDDVEEYTKRNKGLRAARRIALYWRQNKGSDYTRKAPPPSIARAFGAERDIDDPEAIFRGGAAPSPSVQLPLICSCLVLLASGFGALYFLVQDDYEDKRWMGWFCVLVAIASIGAGWYYNLQQYIEGAKYALLYQTGFAVVRGRVWEFYAWKDISEVRIQDETRRGMSGSQSAILFGTLFTVIMEDGKKVLIGMEYFGNVDLGLTIMEQANKQGAFCTGSAGIPP